MSLFWAFRNVPVSRTRRLQAARHLFWRLMLLFVVGMFFASPVMAFQEGAVHSLQMLVPGPTGVVTHNQLDGAMPFSVSIDDAAASIGPGAHKFRGLALGMRNVAVICPAGGKWYLAQPAEDGSFSVDVIVPDVTGPISVDVFSWDSPPNDPNYKVNIDARFELFVTGSLGSATDAAALAPGGPAAGMKLSWADEFGGPLSVSSSRHADAGWFSGGKPSASGSQYSDALFVSAADHRNPFFLKDGFLRIRAMHVLPDAEHAAGYWWSGHLSTGFPDESASVALRKGYAEVRMKTPLGQGAWPAFWLMDSASTLPSKNYGAVEIDAVEAYGHDSRWYMATQHRWPGAARDEPHSYVLKKISRGDDDPNGFHTYGVKITEGEVVWFYDRVEVYRSALYRSNLVSPFFIMIDWRWAEVGLQSLHPPAITISGSIMFVFTNRTLLRLHRTIGSRRYRSRLLSNGLSDKRAFIDRRAAHI